MILVLIHVCIDAYIIQIVVLQVRTFDLLQLSLTISRSEVPRPGGFLSPSRHCGHGGCESTTERRPVRARFVVYDLVILIMSSSWGHDMSLCIMVANSIGHGLLLSSEVFPVVFGGEKLPCNKYTYCLMAN